MFSLRKLVFRPRVDDWAPLAKFFHADETLNAVASELDALDARSEAERCQQLISQLRQCQDRVFQIIEEMLNEVFPNEADRAPRDFRVKFPDDILHENLPGQLWFGAECLAGGSNIVDREFESEVIRPLAKVLIQTIDTLREALKQQSLKNVYIYPDRVRRLLRQFDLIFAEFELNYVSAMVPVKSVREYDMQLDVAVLFSETLIRAIQRGYITQSMIDYCDPNVMITVPRLAIIHGLLWQSGDGPLCVEKDAEQLPEMFRSFRGFLQKLQELLHTLSDDELVTLERLLSSQDSCNSLTDADVSLVADFHIRKNENLLKTKKDAKNKRESSDTGGTSKGGENDEGQGEDGDCDDTSAPITLSSTTSSSSSSSFSNSPSEFYSDEISVRIERALVSTGNGGRESGTPEVEITYSGRLTTTTMNNEVAENDGDASRNKLLRSRFRSPQDLIHRLFVCIAGVADQLQSSYPSDLRTVLKMVLHPEDVVNVYEVHGKLANGIGREEEVGVEVAAATPNAQDADGTGGVVWVPDEECTTCNGCQAAFTFVRRRHHCRNCGKIFCDRCSRNSAPLPNHGYTKPVRVCNQCFFYKLTPFSSSTTAVDEDNETAASAAPRNEGFSFSNETRRDS